MSGKTPSDPDITSQCQALEDPAADGVAGVERLANEAIEAHRSFRSVALQLSALIVEDDPAQQKLMKRLLSPFFVRVDVAGTFTEAKGRVEQNVYDFVLVDMRLRENGTGADVAVQIRHQSKNQNVPVVITSAEVESGELREWQRYSEADAYLNKSEMVSKLPALVRELVGMERT